MATGCVQRAGLTKQTANWQVVTYAPGHACIVAMGSCVDFSHHVDGCSVQRRVQHNGNQDRDYCERDICDHRYDNSVR